MGETGRYPLIYQSIKLALKYYRRVTELDHNSFAYAALCEQKAHNLHWYKNIESLLKLDEIYDLDHVTAHRVMKTTASKNNKNNQKPARPYSKDSEELLIRLSSFTSKKEKSAGQ